jgi:hypothetical protein
MKIFSLGIDYDTEAPLLAQKDESAFTRGIMRQFAPPVPSFGLEEAPGPTVFRAAEVQRQRTDDLGDPRVVGWTILVNRNDPRCDAYLRILRPLAIRRGMRAPDQPLLFDGSPYEDWHDWLLQNYNPPDLSDPPLYILIVGGPDQVPFRFQSFLDASAAVGRLDFDDLGDLETYVAKIIALEDAPQPVVAREALFFAPDGGQEDATHFSRRFMAEPLARLTENRLGFRTTNLMQQNATRARLQETLAGSHPALVYTASHGLGAPHKPPEFQQQFNGAIVCQKEDGQVLRERLFSAAEIPLDQPFLEGAVFFQFACFGMGTPAQSDFARWDPTLVYEQNTPLDFVSALPKKLLAHPRGPIAYLGHIDTAYLHGFDDPDDPELGERWSPRLKPFMDALQSLLTVQPVGLALQNMNMRFNNANAYLTSIFENSGLNLRPDLLPRVANTYIFRNDAQNYMVLGDPAARLRIPQ